MEAGSVAGALPTLRVDNKRAVQHWNQQAQRDAGRTKLLAEVERQDGDAAAAGRGKKVGGARKKQVLLVLHLRRVHGAGDRRRPMRSAAQKGRQCPKADAQPWKEHAGPRAVAPVFLFQDAVRELSFLL